MTSPRRTYGWRVCSFHEASGEAVVGGRTWRWDYCQQFGPLFVDQHGEGLKNQPNGRHPVWTAFEAWLKELKGERELMNRTPRDERIDRLLRGEGHE